jgi:hypothetical protein
MPKGTSTVFSWMEDKFSPLRVKRSQAIIVILNNIYVIHVSNPF